MYLTCHVQQYGADLSLSIFAKENEETKKLNAALKERKNNKELDEKRLSAAEKCVIVLEPMDTFAHGNVFAQTGGPSVEKAPQNIHMAKSQLPCSNAQRGTSITA